MDDQNKKLKMEKLSPIPVSTPTNLPEAYHTPIWQSTPKSSCHPRRDSYSIESTSSPEVDPPRLLGTEKFGSKGRARSHLTPRNKNSASKKPTRSTPLLGLISRKSAGNLKRNGETQDGRLPIIEEDSQFAKVESLNRPEIETVTSPQKASLDRSMRHVITTDPKMIFPFKPKPSLSTYHPLSGIVMKTFTNYNRSLNESTTLLMNIEPEDEVHDEESVPEADVSIIEPFESPIRLSEKHQTPVVLEDFPVIGPQSSSNSDKGGNEYLVVDEGRGQASRKRKRALDFSSQTFLDAPNGDALILDATEDSTLKPTSQENIAQSNTIVKVDEVPFESDDESVIEGTLKRNPRNESDSLGGFATCSTLLIEVDSPQRENDVSELPREPLIQIHEELCNDALEVKNNDLKLIVLSHDSSNSELETSAESEKLIKSDPEPSIVLNVTKKIIHSDETPTKTKTFFEAVEIETCGSPDSVVSVVSAPDEENAVEDDKINTTSTQEDFIDESEQIKTNKRRKKGSLMERARAVIAQVEASSSLFDYEMKAGLRQNTGKFVSCPLVVCRKWDGEESSILICKRVDDLDVETDTLAHLVALMVQKAPNGSVGCVVSVHFPLTILYNGVLKIPFALVGNQMIIHSSQSVASFNFNVADAMQKAHFDPTSGPFVKPVTGLRTFPSNQIQFLLEAALCQNLTDEVVLVLKVRHIVRINQVSKPHKVAVLCCDDELNYCWVEFNSEKDIKRATALETLHILSDGSHVQLQGFRVVNWTPSDRKTRNLINYCSNEAPKYDTKFTVRPTRANWIVSSSGRPRDVRKARTPLQIVLTENVPGKRYLIHVESVESDELGFRVKDSTSQIQFILSENSFQRQFDLSSAPFSLDGCYFYDGKLFLDEFAKIIRTS